MRHHERQREHAGAESPTEDHEDKVDLNKPGRDDYQESRNEKDVEQSELASHA